MSSSDASPSTSALKHDVFISFRGEDTRIDFTSHLHDAFCQKGIKSFIDYDLPKGKEVWPKLEAAIENSYISVVVFSKEYAFSSWCMNELLKILECTENKGQEIIPVFYKIDPSHVRKQKESYEKAFIKHEQVLGEEGKSVITNWKAALTKAANISGYDKDSRIYRDDAEMVKNIVNDVLQKLYLRFTSELKGLVKNENDKICEKIELSLDDFQAIGIWGVSGIGKTTIAKMTFAKLFPQYDSVCFLANVGKESKRHGISYLQDKLHSELLKGENPKSNVGSEFNKRRLYNNKALIVLDDVDSFNQLELLDNFYGENGDLGPNIRFIITTEDRKFLVGRVRKIYPVKRWNDEESLELFSLNAFKQNHPQEGYEDLSKRAVKYAGNVPLALKILGLNLRANITTESWESTLTKLKEYPDDEIQNVSRASYDRLEPCDQEIFLDIAFCFKEEYRKDVIRILDACGFYATHGIDILVNKALITISETGRIQMYDRLQEMGLEIARRKHNIDPGNQSRLRDIKEVYYGLENNKGTEKVEGIILDLSQIERDLHLHADAFSTMKMLKFLKFYVPSGKNRSGSVLLSEVPTGFSSQLRYFEWNGYPLNSLPTTFSAEFLVEIRMPQSHITELWQDHEMQKIMNLEGIDLTECKQLMKLPNLSKARKLKWVYLSGCENLGDLDPSILSLDTLETLILNRCTNLKSLKSEKHSTSLKEINVNDCSSLQEFSVSSDVIERLLAINCSSLVTVTTSKTFFTSHMQGKRQHISFESSINLDEHSVGSIMKGTELTMISAAFQNKLARKCSEEIYFNNYNSVEVCLPGSQVPKHFKYKESGSCIPIDELPIGSGLLGFIFCVVLSPSETMNHVDGVKIQCQYHWADGTKAGKMSMWDYKVTKEWNSDHVFIWYDPSCCESILLYDEQKVSFAFSVTTGTEEREGFVIGVKDCGVQLIHSLEFSRLLMEFDLELGRKVELEASLRSKLESQCQAILTSMEGCDGNESNGIITHYRNQERDFSERPPYDNTVEVHVAAGHEDEEGIGDTTQVDEVHAPNEEDVARRVEDVIAAFSAELSHGKTSLNEVDVAAGHKDEKGTGDAAQVDKACTPIEEDVNDTSASSTRLSHGEASLNEVDVAAGHKDEKGTGDAAQVDKACTPIEEGVNDTSASSTRLSHGEASLNGETAREVYDDFRTLAGLGYLSLDAADFLTGLPLTCPSVHLENQSTLSQKLRGFAYEYLADKLRTLMSHPMQKLLGPNRPFVLELLKDVRRFPFPSSWLDEIQHHLNQLVYEDKLQSLLDSEARLSRKVDIIRCKLEDTEAELAETVHQKQQILESTFSFN